jgi:hypothetical protein
MIQSVLEEGGKMAGREERVRVESGFPRLIGGV